MYYFAYGSNLSKKQMNERCPDNKVYQIAVLKNYRLEFSRYSSGRKGGVLSIIPNKTDEVRGVVYSISGIDMINLNKNEGVSSKCYYPEIVQVELKNGSKVCALTYIAFREKDHVPPAADYLQLIVEGAKVF